MRTQKPARAQARATEQPTKAKALARPPVDATMKSINRALKKRRLARNKEFATCKPSRLLEMSIEDLEAVYADPRYLIEMSIWHHSYDYAYDYAKDECDRKQKRRDVCYVCQAGSSMAKSLKASPDDELDLHHFGGELRRRFAALNDFRQGEVHNALAELGVRTHAPGILSYTKDSRIEKFNDMSYGGFIGPKKVFKDFVAAMREIVADLKRVGQ